jgi:hypothetical protein
VPKPDLGNEAEIVRGHGAVKKDDQSPATARNVLETAEFLPMPQSGKENFWFYESRTILKSFDQDLFCAGFVGQKKWGEEAILCWTEGDMLFPLFFI